MVAADTVEGKKRVRVKDKDKDKECCGSNLILGFVISGLRGKFNAGKELTSDLSVINEMQIRYGGEHCVIRLCLSCKLSYPLIDSFA